MQIVTRTDHNFGKDGLPPSGRPVGRIKLALSTLLGGILLVGIFVAIYVLGSIIAAIFLVLLLVSLVVFIIKTLFGLPSSR
jgi:hypothetical protein